MAEQKKKPSIAVLVSGGLDSSVLCIDLAQSYELVYPVYIAHGLLWEDTELGYLKRFLSTVDHPQVAPLSELSMPVADLYDTSHWSLSGENVPDESTDDSAVYLPGRNLMLLTKLAVWCERKGIASIALAPLAGNPFSDNTRHFYASMEDIIEQALGAAIKIVTPYREMDKASVIQRGSAMPLEQTFSCIIPIANPVDASMPKLHCGRCNKCAERALAFARSRVDDNTHYASQPELSRL